MKRNGIGRIIAGCSLVVLSIAATLVLSLIPGLYYEDRAGFISIVLYICIPPAVLFLVFGIRCYRNVSKIAKTDPKTAAQQIAAENLKIFDILQRSKFLSKNEFTRTDTVIFTFFITRSFCITKITDRNKAYEFSNEYVKAITDGIRNTFMCFNRDLVSEMFYNRAEFYDGIVMNKDLDNPMEALTFQFENIISHDIRSKRYVPITEDMPVVLSDFKESMMQQIEAEVFYKAITVLAEDILARYDKIFSSWK